MTERGLTRLSDEEITDVLSFAEHAGHYDVVGPYHPLIAEMARELQSRRARDREAAAGTEEKAYDEWQRTRDRLSDVTSLWFNEIRHFVPEGGWKRGRFNAAFRQAEALLCEPGPPAHSDRAGAARGEGEGA